VAACEDFLKSFGALGEGMVEFVAVAAAQTPSGSPLDSFPALPV
jgi:hypothetical protein